MVVGRLREDDRLADQRAADGVERAGAPVVVAEPQEQPDAEVQRHVADVQPPALAVGLVLGVAHQARLGVGDQRADVGPIAARPRVAAAAPRSSRAARASRRPRPAARSAAARCRRSSSPRRCTSRCDPRAPRRGSAPGSRWWRRRCRCPSPRSSARALCAPCASRCVDPGQARSAGRLATAVPAPATIGQRASAAANRGARRPTRTRPETNLSSRTDATVSAARPSRKSRGRGVPTVLTRHRKKKSPRPDGRGDQELSGPTP